MVDCGHESTMVVPWWIVGMKAQWWSMIPPIDKKLLLACFDDHSLVFKAFQASDCPSPYVS